MDEGRRCEAERSERRDEIVSEDMLRDKGGVEAKRRREVFLSWRDFARSELGNFFLFVSISTGGLNTRWLSRARTSR